MRGPPVQIALSRALSRRRRGRRGSRRRSGPTRPGGPWEPCVRAGWTRGPRDLHNFRSVSLPFPRLSLLGCWAPLVPWEKRGAGRLPWEAARRRDRSPHLSGRPGLALQPPPLPPLRPGRPLPAPLRCCSRPSKAEIWGRARRGPRRLSSQAWPLQAGAETLPRPPVLVPTARSQQWSDKKDKVGE